MPNSIDLLEIKGSLVHYPLYRENLITWLLNFNGKFTISLTWEEFRQRKNRVSWYNLIWFKRHFLRHFLIAWLGIKGKLMTKDRF